MILQQTLELLKSKFSGVRKDGLEQLARLLALQCSSLEEVKPIVEKLSEEQVDGFVKDYRKQVDKEVTQGNETFELNLRKKYKLTKIEGKDGSEKPEEQSPKPDEGDLASLVASAVSSAIKPLQEKLALYEEGELNKTRLQALQEKLGACKDETFKAQSLSDFARMSFKDEQAFNEYLEEKGRAVREANQRIADERLKYNSLAPKMNERGEGGVSTAVSEYLQSLKPEGNNLAGKEV